MITNPLDWPQITSYASDGSYVEEGEVIAEFDRVVVEQRLEESLRRREVVAAELERKLTELANREKELRDRVLEIEDNLAVLKTRLQTQRALPDPQEVEIAEGRLEVARLSFEAARHDLEKAEGRLERQMISPGEYGDFRNEFRRQQARFENARRHLAYAKLPATTTTIRKLELQIENLTMERDKVAHELEENASLSTLEKSGAEAEMAMIEQRLEENREDLEKTSVRAPISGYLVHLRRFKTEVLEGGNKMWKNSPFMKIPDPTTLAFKGQIPEAERRFLKPGDPVAIRVNAGLVESIPGRIHSISEFSRDMGEKEEGNWGGPSKTGVMVYDVVVRPDTVPGWVRPGMYADCELMSAGEFSGPAVPAGLIKTQSDGFFLAVDGIYRKVGGALIDGWLLLDDSSLLGKPVGLYGTFPDAADSGSGDSAASRWSGALEPSNTEDVFVKRIHRWQKVTWLVPEDTVVAKGDVVARLDAKESKEELRKRKSEHDKAKNAADALVEQMKLKDSEFKFTLQRETNLREIARLDLQTVRDGRDALGMFDAELSLEEAVIKREDLEVQLARLKKRPAEFVSSAELTKLQRDLTRAKLQEESARIRLERLRRGPTELELGAAQLKFQEQTLKVETLTRENETERFRLERDLVRARKRESRTQRRVERVEREIDNLTLYAPRDGVVQYAQLYSNGSIAKVSVGTMLGYRHVPMKIADTSRMYARLEMPEKYFTQVRKGMPVEVRIPSITHRVLVGKVTEIEFLFEDKRKKDTQVGLYSSHESLGETVFYVRVEVDAQDGIALKPGAAAHVTFPFEK